MGNTGRIIKSKNAGNYTTIPNEVCRATNISLEEKGLLTYLLSLPADWVVYRQNLYNQLPDPKFKIDRTFRSLQDKGFINSIRMHDESSGKFIGWEHIVNDTSPTLRKPDIGETRDRLNPKSVITEIGETRPITKKDINTNKDYNKERVCTAFEKPTLEQVGWYFEEKGHPDQAERFFNYYESNGWKVGKNPMKNWKAAVNNWIKNQELYAIDKKRNGNAIAKNDYAAASAQYDFDKYGDIPVSELFGIAGRRPKA